MSRQASPIAVLYDGGCPFCLRSIRWLRHLDRYGRLEFLNARDWEPISRRFPRLDRQACLEEIHVVHPNGKILRGFDAYRSLARVLPGARLLAPLLHLPGIAQIGRPMARGFARHRMRIAFFGPGRFPGPKDS